MTELGDVNKALTDADQPGYAEVVEGEAPAVVAEVQLSAVIIDQAYQDLKAALREQMAAELHRRDVLLGQDDEYSVVKKIEIKAEYGVKLAQAEVDRVTTLLNFFQAEAIFKSTQLGE